MRAVGISLAAALCCSAVQAGVIRGVVLDHSTGRPLARARVSLACLPGSGYAGQTVRTTTGGQFVFPSIPAGAYLVESSRSGFATTKYGQRAWNAPGFPVLVEPNSDLFLQFRLHRLAAIGGQIWDENEIGLPEQRVVAYANTRPPRRVAEAKTDDRGIYRIPGLTPGSYLVRSAAGELDDGSGLAPTFYKEVAAVEDARPVEVDLDQEVQDISFRPSPGKIVRIRGQIYNPFQVPIPLVLASDMGRIHGSTDAVGNFEFARLSPGSYELYAFLDAHPAAWGGYRRFFVDKEEESVALDFRPLPILELKFESQEGGKVDAAAISVFARRKDLAGTGEPVKLPPDHIRLAPGTWEFQVAAPPYLYPVEVGDLRRNRANRADGWNEVMVYPAGGTMPVLVRLSSMPASLRGKVAVSGGDPAIGAPVYLEAFDPDSGKRITDLRSTRTDARGEYRFQGLTPGVYRVLSTFAFENPDEQVLGNARALSVTLKAASDTVQDLDLYAQ